MTDQSDIGVGTVLGHAAALGGLATAILGWLPALGASVALIWYVIQISESKTFREFLERRRRTKIAKLRAQIEALSMKVPDDSGGSSS